MKRLVFFAVVVFWIAMSAIWVLSWLTPGATSQREAGHSSPAATIEVARTKVTEHGTAESCWLIIEGRVYDVTGYVEQHPADPRTILNYCGKDATQAFATKDRGRPHSAHAERLLDRYLVGPLKPD